LTHGALAAAIAWRFMQIKLQSPLADTDCPALAAHSTRVEALPAFAATPAVETANVSTPGYRA
jgi:glutathione S-transferase